MPYHESYAQALEGSASQQAPGETILSPEAADKLNRAAEAIGAVSVDGAQNPAEQQDNVYELPIGPVGAGELQAAANELAAHTEVRDIAA